MSLPRYKFDPVTQRYTLLTPQEEQQKAQQENKSRLETLYDVGDGGMTPSSHSGPGISMMTPGVAEIGVGFQNAGLALSGIPTLTTQVAGMASTGIGNAMMGSQVSPVANPSPMTITAIDPVATLVAMNETVAKNVAEDAKAQAQAQAVATVAEAATTAAPGVTDAPAADTATDSSGGGYGGDNAPPGDSPSDAPSDAPSSDPGEKEGGLISMKRYADGGMTMSPQNYGRMGDSMLVHMNPREVAGLQSLARSQGTSLTVNPQTGYPEAFNLQALLPIIAGLALGPAGYGLTAVNAGLATAALGTVATGSLKKGLMAGLGAYGGAGLGEGLAGAAATPTPGMEGAIGGGITPTPAPTTLPTTPVNLTVDPASGIASTDPLAATYNLPSQPPTTFDNLATAGIKPTVNPNLGFEGAPPLGVTNVQPTALNVPPSAATTTRTAGLSAAPTPDKFIGNLSGKDALKYGTAALSSIPPPEYEPPKSTAMLRPYDYSFNPITGAYDPRPGDSSEVLYGTSTFTPREVVPARAGGMMSSYAAGGLAAFKEGGRPKSRRLMDEKGLGGIPYYDFMGERGSNLDSVEKNFAQGGTPRFLSGGGDGMSDDIPAMIGDKQPARLADGEFVIPADVVSHIGNGSSKAGAKRLYKMMADIREERTGKTKQAPAIKPDRYMPA